MFGRSEFFPLLCVRNSGSVPRPGEKQRQMKSKSPKNCKEDSETYEELARYEGLSAETAWEEIMDLMDEKKMTVLRAIRGREASLTYVLEKAEASQLPSSLPAYIGANAAFWRYLRQYGKRGFYNGVREAKDRLEGPDGLVYTKDGSILLYCADGNLASVTLRPGTVAVAGCAFYGCNALEKVVLDESTEYIGQDAFGYMKNLGEVVFTGKKPLYIEPYAFSNSTALEEIALPEGTAFVLEGTFSGCSSLAKVHIPESVSCIGEMAFRDTALKEVTIPENAEDVDGSAFYGCRGIKIKNRSRLLKDDGTFIIKRGALLMTLDPGAENVVIPARVKEIGESAFYDADMKSLTMTGVRFIGAHAFEECGFLKDLSLGKKLTGIGDNAFFWCSSLETVDIPDGVETIGLSAFQQCTSLKEIRIPDSVTTILPRAFCWCQNLRNVTIPESVEYLDAYVFQGCESLTDISLPDSVTVVSFGVFDCCTNLKSVVLGKNVKTVRSGAFCKCGALSSLTCTSPLPPECRKDVFEDVNLDECVLKVPRASVEMYKKAGGWRDFRNIRGI